MLRPLLMMSFIVLNACSANYMSRGILAPVESRDGSNAVIPERSSRSPDSTVNAPSSQQTDSSNGVRIYPGRINSPGIEQSTQSSQPETTYPSATTYPPISSSQRTIDQEPAISDHSSLGTLPTQREGAPFISSTPRATQAAPTRPLPPAIAQPQVTGSPASALLASVDTAMADGELERAAALAERALRISPRDGYLWYKLASIRFQQERYSDAAGFAQRALSFAGTDRILSDASNTLLGMIKLEL